ncbi:MAG: hypothetical protein ACK5OX_16115 [Desertimonas sp.]
MTTPATRRLSLQRVAWASLLAVMLGFDLVATGWLGFNERIVAMARNVVLPGLGFVETDRWLAVGFVTVAVVAVVAWLRWGTDWIVAAVWVAGLAVAYLVVPASHTHGWEPVADPLPVKRSSHEFAAVLVLVAAATRARLALGRIPGLRRRPQGRADVLPDRRTALAAARPVERCRAAAIAALADPPSRVDEITVSLAEPDVRRRAARVAAVARWRLRADPLRHDNAHVHAALTLCRRATDADRAAFLAIARPSPYGVPASEPTWVRLLDGTLAALALESSGEEAAVGRWRATLSAELRLRHGRRAAAIHTPTFLRLATAAHWEHATATALARWRNWIGDDDWDVLRQHSLGAAARGATGPHDARLVAAARIWARLLGDHAATNILDRPSRSADPIAAALDDVLATIRPAPAPVR